MSEISMKTVSRVAIPVTARRRRRPHLPAFNGTTVAAIIILALGALVIMVPFYWMVSTSLKEQGNLYLYPPQWIPNPVILANFKEVWDTVPFARFTLNTAVIVALVMTGTLLSCSFSAYGFARLRAPGRDAIFVIVLATMMLPSAVTLVPTYIGFNKLGWTNSILPLVIPSFFGAPFYIFLLRQFYLSIPKDLEESGRIDGASAFRIWWDLMLPLTKPALATVAVFTFFATYNDFFGPLIYLNDQEKQTIAVGLSYFTGSPTVGPKMHLLMAMTLMATIPTLTVFLFAQRYFVQSIVTTGVKG
jgi:multiple sugar transport system permease protein/sn-glycerol 3-phosphate transport system permease protein